MGKTYRYDPEAKRGQKRKLQKVTEEIGIPTEMRSEEKTVSVAKVLKMIRKPVASDLNRLVENEIMHPQELDYYTHYIEEKVCELIPKFDPNHVGKNGRPISASTYFIGAALNITLHVCRYLGQQKRQAIIVPLTGGSPEEAKEKGEVSVESLSDGCRSVKELEFRMDVETLRMMLTQEERAAFDMLIEGYTHEEIANRIGCPRLRVTRTLLPHIQRIARACGFIPQSEIRVMERSVKAA